MAAGIGLLARGLVAYRRGAVVSSIASSHTNSLAAGEVRLSGTVEALASTLVSPLQSQPCVWYHSRVVQKGDSNQVLLDEQRAVEFQIRDDSGTARVIPRGARFQLAPTFDATTDLFGAEPPELNRRVGAASMAVPDYDRDVAIADLLTVRPPSHDMDTDGAPLLRPGMHRLGRDGRHYTESRLAPGTKVTLVGFARPFGELDPFGAEAAAAMDPVASDDPAIAAELAEARESGTLALSAREAWGNAAIPGFGIGRPVERPTLDADAATPLPADAAQVARSTRIFEIPAETLVIASGPSRPLTIYEGTPSVAWTYDRSSFYRGLAGGGLAAACALLVAVTVNGGL